MLRGRLVEITGALVLLVILILDTQFTAPIWIYGVVVLVFLVIIGVGSATISSQFFIRVRCQGDTTTGSISITFDDGPIPGKTEKILDILKTYGVPATFFCIGRRVDGAPELLRRINQEGHLIGNHSYFHSKLFDLQSSSKMSHEMDRTDKTIAQLTGKKPRFFRPPYGVTNPMLARAVRTLNYTTVGWNIRSLDSITERKDSVLQRVTRNLKAGDLVLFHDYADVTIEVLPEFLNYVKKKGLKIAPLDELLHEQAYA